MRITHTLKDMYIDSYVKFQFLENLVSIRCLVFCNSRVAHYCIVFRNDVLEEFKVGFLVNKFKLIISCWLPCEFILKNEWGKNLFKKEKQVFETEI